MIIDVTGIELNPGNYGRNCKGNGSTTDEFGNLLECCCDECDYMMCCIDKENDCQNCTDEYCPNVKYKKKF